MKKQGDWRLSAGQAQRLNGQHYGVDAGTVVTVEHRHATIYEVYDKSGRYHGVLDLSDDGEIDLKTTDRWQ